jgi:hypothetical protein
MAISKINTNSIADDAVTTAKVNPAQTDITSVGTLTSFASTGIDDNADATAITIDSSERIGIGTTSPSDGLHVKGGQIKIESSAGDGAYLRIDNDANTNGDIWRVGAGVKAHGTFSIYNQSDNLFPFDVDILNKCANWRNTSLITALDDEAQINVCTDTQAIILVSSYSYGRLGVFMHDWIGSPNLISGSTLYFSTSDTDGKYCLISSANSYTCTLKNRFGGTGNFTVLVMGTYR